MNIPPFWIFLAGLIIITIGAELVLRGSSKLASLLGISPILIGLTVVSIGTSLPELAVGITAIKEGSGDIAVGNIAGTNIVNILLILGLSAAIRPLPLHLKSIKSEVFVMIFAAILLLVLSFDGTLSYIDGMIMLTLGILYLIMLVKNSKKESPKIIKEYEEEYEPSTKEEKSNWKTWVINSVTLLLGMAGTIYGAELLVNGAVDIAITLGLSESVIGLTIIAIGTSAPELVTTIVATIKNDRDVAVGNLLGSSINNILLILGATCLFSPQGLRVEDDILWIDLPLAAAVALVCYPVFRSGQMVSRREGIIFVAAYIAYISFILFVRT